MPPEESFQQLVLQVHQAATDPTQWEALLTSVAGHFSASAAVIMTPGEINTHERFLWSCYNVVPEAQVEYGTHWVSEDPWLLGMQRKRLSMKRGSLHIADSYLPRADYLKTAFYNDFAARYGFEGHVAMFVEEEDGMAAIPATHLSLFRGPGAAPFSLQELKPLRALYPHLHQAVRTHWLLTATRWDAVRDTLDASAHATFLLSADAKIQYANPAAERMQRLADVLGHRQGALERIGRMGPSALINAVRLAAKGTGQTLVTWWPVPRSRLQTAIVRIAPIEKSARFDAAGRRSAVLVTVETQDPSLRARALQHAVAQQCRLTPAEIRVLDAVMRGLTPEMCAIEQGVQVSTIRTHLASLLHKTGCRRQSDLLRLDEDSP